MNKQKKEKEKWNENVEECSECGIEWKKIGQQCSVCYAPAKKKMNKQNKGQLVMEGDLY